MEINKTKDILSETKSFYQNIYKQNKNITDNTDFFNEINLNVLSDEKKNQCEGKLSEYKCAMPLKGMNNNKSPGSDGLTTEFFKIFWNTIKTFYLDSINLSFETKYLTLLQKRELFPLYLKR